MWMVSKLSIREKDRDRDTERGSGHSRILLSVLKKRPMINSCFFFFLFLFVT